VCRHAERPRIDYLIAAGSEIKPLGQKFRLGASAETAFCFGAGTVLAKACAQQGKVDVCNSV
jgi:hypothetical protein